MINLYESRPRMMPGDRYSRHVLVLDGVPETTEVLQALLEPQGIRVSQIRAPEPVAEVSCDLVVIHDGETRHVFSRLDISPEVPRIHVDCSVQGADSADFYSPFHYSDLLNRIQELLESSSVAI